MRKLKIILCVFLSVAISFTLFACGKKDDETASTPSAPATSPSGDAATSGSAAPGVSDEYVSIKIGVSSYLGRFLDGSTPAQSYIACDGVYDTLFYTNRETKEAYSFILEDWHYEDDLTFVMTLKPGITFSNGEEATAEDLLFSVTNHFDRLTSNTTLLGPIDPQNSYTDGDYTAVIKYTTPYGPGLTANVLYLYNKSWCEQTGWDSQDWYDNPCGTGPYECVEYVADDHITLQLRDGYWNAANTEFAVDEWIVKYYPDLTTMYMDLELGNISLCQVGATDYDRYISQGGDSNIVMQTRSMGDVGLFEMGYYNTDVFDDINVRAALAYGVDWAAVGTLGSGGLFNQATSTIPSTSPFYINVGTYEYNPEKAKQILADAGYKDGDIKIHIYTMLSDSYKNMSEGFQYYCSQIGIDVNVEFGDVTSALAKWQEPGGSDAGFMNNNMGTITSEPFVTYMSMTGRLFTWTTVGDEYFLEKATEAVYTVDNSKRMALYKELQQYVYDNYLVFPISETMSVVGYRNDIYTQEQIDKYVYHASYLVLQGLSLAD